MGMIRTTLGLLDEATIARTLGFEDRPDKLVIWVEWRKDAELVRRDAFPLPRESGPLVHTTNGDRPFAVLERTIELRDGAADIAVAVCWREGGDLVRRDVHVVLKEPSVVAEAIAASL